MQRVAITGFGAVTPVGNDAETTWRSLVAGKSGVRKIDTFDDHGFMAPAGPAAKRPATCYIILQVHNGKWVRYDSPSPGFRCNDGGYYSG